MIPEQTPLMKEKSFFTVNVIGAIILGLIVGFLIGAYYGKYSDMKDETDDLTMIDRNSTSSSLNGASNSLTASLNDGIASVAYSKSSSQASVALPNKNEAMVFESTAGNSVVLKSISLSNAYWVAIRDVSASGRSQYVLGARRLQAGTNGNIIISLSRNTVAGGQYEIALYKNNGAAFNYDASNFVASLGTFSVK